MGRIDIVVILFCPLISGSLFSAAGLGNYIRGIVL